MKVSHYVSLPNVVEISSPVKVEVASTRPTLDLSNCFLTAHSYRTHVGVTDVDEHVKFDINFLVNIVDSVLDGMTVESLINFDDIEYREEEGWAYVLDLQDELLEHINQLPDWQLMMAADRLQRLSHYIETKHCDWTGWLGCHA